MEGDKSPPPAKKPKVSIEDERAEAVAPVDHQDQHPTNGGIARSPITVPMLFPEMWEKAFGFLPSSDLITILNTCPEWNHLLTSQKPTILLPKVLELLSLRLPLKDALACRLVNKACKAGIDLAYPEIPQDVEVYNKLRIMLIEWAEARRGNGNNEEEELAQENSLHGD